MTGAGLALGEARRLGELAPLGEFLIIVSISRCSCIPGRRAAGGRTGPALSAKEAVPARSRAGFTGWLA